MRTIAAAKNNRQARRPGQVGCPRTFSLGRPPADYEAATPLPLEQPTCSACFASMLRAQQTRRQIKLHPLMEIGARRSSSATIAASSATENAVSLPSAGLSR